MTGERVQFPARDARLGSQKTWTRELIIAAIQRWAEVHGEPPKMDEWHRITDETPVFMTVTREFGTWNAAIAAAGLPPRKQGGWRNHKK